MGFVTCWLNTSVAKVYLRDEVRWCSPPAPCCAYPAAFGPYIFLTHTHTEQLYEAFSLRGYLPPCTTKRATSLRLRQDTGDEKAVPKIRICYMLLELAPRAAQCFYWVISLLSCARPRMIKIWISCRYSDGTITILSSKSRRYMPHCFVISF